MIDTTTKLQCRGCGSSLSYSSADQNLKCPYCGTITEIPKVAEEAPKVAQSIYPINVEVSTFIDAIYEHLASGEFTPDHLLEHATFTKTERFYVPAFEFFGSYEAQWTASFGYDRRENYVEYVNRTENGRSRQVAVNKTKIVTDWHPVNGTDTGKFNVRAYAGARLLGKGENVIALAENRGSQESVPFDTSYLAGIDLEEFSATEVDAYMNRAKAQINEIIDRNVEKHGQGDRQRDWHWTADISKASETVLVPVCHATFEFEGKEYNSWASGANVSKLVADALPVDKNRKKSIRNGFIPAAVTAVASIFACLQNDSNGGSAAVALLASIAYGYFRKHTIIAFSLQLRKALLAGRQVASVNMGILSAFEQNELNSKLQRPKKPWLANTGNDAWQLPVISILFAVASFSSMLINSNPSSQLTEASSPVRQQPVASTNPLPVSSSSSSSENAGIASTFPRCAGSTELAKCEDQERRWATETPQQKVEREQRTEEERSRNAAEVNGESSSSTQQSQASTESPPQSSAGGNPTVDPRIVLLSKALGFASSNNWAAVDGTILSVKAQAVVIPQGDRKASRTANNEGLALLKSGDNSGAVDAFFRGISADPADVEVRNNLGYALLKAQRNVEAAKVLSDLLVQVPDRTSGWTNYSESVATNTVAALAALKIGVRFSANREKTVSFLRPLAESHPNENYRQVIRAVLNDIDSIPSAPLK